MYKVCKVWGCVNLILLAGILVRLFLNNEFLVVCGYVGSFVAWMVGGAY